MEKLWGATLEVNVKNFKYNFNSIKKYVGENVDIMPIIKDNAYGTKINERIDILKDLGIKIVGVAIVDEAIYLRNIGYEGEILILNQISEEEIPALLNYNIIAGIGSIDFLKKIGRYNGTFKVHMEIGTGMGRTGIRPDRTFEYIEEAERQGNIKIDGIYTHFSCSDCDEEYTQSQLESFKKAVKVAKKKIKELRYIHCCNSAGIINFKDAHFNLVRPGLILHGYYPSDNLKDKISLKPCTKLKSRISFIKKVAPGISISYGRRFITKRDTVIATVPLGYADGVRRSLSNRGNVVINGKKAPIIGSVCMDSFMVDVTDLENTKVGDSVYIWDNENITLEDVANLYDTITYEVISTISDRVIRKYVSD